jgi:hypothetical protein
MVVVFMHIPAYCTQHIRAGQEKPERSLVVVNREALYQILAPYKARIIVGHMHETEHLTQEGVRQHVCGAVCGAWWTGPICADGTPNGYGVFEVTGEDIRWRYKATGFSPDEQIRVYPVGSDPAAPDHVVANVWDWRPDWVVAWYENGMRRGVMEQRRGKDPLAVRLHTGPSLPAKHTWVEPYTTDHLFYAPVAKDALEVFVEATDPWGKIYRAKLS